MTRPTLMLLAAFMLAQVSNPAASERSYLSAGFGRTFLCKPEIAKRYVDDGYNGSVGVGFDFTREISMHITGEYHLGPISSQSESWLRGNYVKVKCAFLWLKLSPCTVVSRLSPFVLAGVGYAYADEKRSAGAVTYGVGADFRLSSSIGVFIEARHVKAYHKDSNIEGRPVKAGLTYLLRK